jgi:phosphate-selective porin
MRLLATALATTLLASAMAPAARAQVVAEDAETAVTAPEPRAPATETPGPTVEFRFKKRPSMRIGDAIRLDLTARMQADVHGGVGNGNDGDVDVDMARRRIGVKGSVSHHVEFELEREIGDETAPWRDAFVNVRTLRALQVRAGQFKMPFSLDQLTSPSDLDFIYRSRAADLLAPGRSVGASVHGRVAAKVIGYDAGLFRRDGETARFGSNPGAGRTVAARITVAPRGRARHPKALRDVEAGFSVTSGDVAEGRYSLRGRLTSRDAFFSPIYVNGHRVRTGADVNWRPGPFDVRAEVMRADDERRGQGLLGETLPAVRAQGWYVTGVWAVAGRRAHAASRSAFSGVAGLELAARVEQVSFGSTGSGDLEVRTPRAAHLPVVSEQAWTLGVNWNVVRTVRVQANAVREQIIDTALYAPPATGAVWRPVVRLQFAM